MHYIKTQLSPLSLISSMRLWSELSLMKGGVEGIGRVRVVPSPEVRLVRPNLFFKTSEEN